MSWRFENLEDLFEIKCRKCGSVDVDLSTDDCHECGITIGAHCNSCGSTYDYHNFKEIEVGE